MDRGDEITAVLLSLLRIGLLRIRAYGWQGHPEKCALEAEHLHNLPELVRDPRVEELSYYYDVTRIEFMKRADDVRQFEPEWKRLRELMDTSTT